MINLVVIGLVGVVLVQNRTRNESQATLLSENYARILEQNLSGFIDKIDITLLTVRDEVVRQTAQGGINDKALATFLDRQDTHIPAAHSLRVTDAEGIVRYAGKNVEIRDTNGANRQAFIRLRDHPEAGMVISRPSLGPRSEKWQVTLSRRIEKPDGTFAGTVYVPLKVTYFIDLLAQVDLGEHGNSGLWDQTQLIARYSNVDRQGASVGATTPSAELRKLLESAPKSAIYHAHSGIDGVSRIYAFRRINDHPLFLVVGLADVDYLTEWKADSQHLAGITGLFVFFSILAAMLIDRNMKQQEKDHQHQHRLEAENSTRLKHANQAAEDARQQSQLLLSSVGEGICGMDLDGTVLFVNPAACKLLGYSKEEMVGHNMHDLTHHHHADGRIFPKTECAMFLTLHDGHSRQVKDEVYWRKDGSTFPVEYLASVMAKEDRVTGVVNVFRDISERKRLEERITHMALFDELTGLPNRAFVSDSLSRLVAGAQRRHEGVAILYLDLDGFKQVNDSHGHAAGDAVLREVADRLRGCVRADDVAARLGGDEFLVVTLCKRDTLKENSITLAERILEAIQYPVALPDGQGQAQVGISIGIVFVPESESDLETYIQKADAAMYQAKSAGKGRYVLATDVLD